MTINEEPSLNLIGRQVDRSTSRQVDNSVLEDYFFSLGVWGACPPGVVCDHASGI